MRSDVQRKDRAAVFSVLDVYKRQVYEAPALTCTLLPSADAGFILILLAGESSVAIVIITRKLRNPLQIMINGIWFVIASPSMQAAVVFVESPLNWITSIGGFKGRI